MKRIILIGAVLLAFVPGGFAQKVVENYTAQQGAVRYGAGEKDLAPFGPKGYTLVLPENGHAVSGTIVDLEDLRGSETDTTTYASFRRASLKRGYAFLTIATGKPMDWYFDASSLRFVDTIMRDTFTRYSLPNKNVYLVGLMTAGHRALKYVEYCKKGKAAFVPAIRGVILSECAIDWVRMWYESQKQVRDHETASSAFEGNLVHYIFDQHFHATPATPPGTLSIRRSWWSGW